MSVSGLTQGSDRDFTNCCGGSHQEYGIRAKTSVGGDDISGKSEVTAGFWSVRGLQMPSRDVRTKLEQIV